MIKIEIEGIEDLVRFINLFVNPENEQIQISVNALNEASDKLIEAENKDGVKNASTGSN